MNIILPHKLKSSIVLAALLIMAAAPVTALGSEYQKPDNRVVIDGQYVGINFEVDEGIRHIPVRQVFEQFGATVLWSDENLVSIEYGEQTYYPEFFIKHDRAYVSENYVASVLGRNSHFNEEINVLAINSNGDESERQALLNALPSYDGYSGEDLKWLSQIIHAEANGEPYEAKIAVGNVILNRMAAPQYPDTIKDVIFDRKSGVQFTPTTNGSIYNTPSVDSYMAAVEVLEGKRNAEGALFFINPRYAKSSWVSRNRPYAFTMNNHDFYY